ncbi:MAG: DUF4381 domain-containing protein [Thiotrichales bacterium]|nr:DUF4381 domain-containing protein [Thiotrichales bacterium]
MDPQALAQLHDIQLPEPIGWWPLAFAWWILLLSLTSILLGSIWYVREQRRRNAYRRQALQKLQHIMAQESADSTKIQQMNHLLKQVAITAYGRKRVAGLHQSEWFTFLQTNAHYIPQPPSLSAGLEQAYGPPHADAEQRNLWHHYSERWIKGHHQ